MRSAIVGQPKAQRQLAERLRCVRYILVARCRRLGQILADDVLDDIAQDVTAIVLSKLEEFDGRGKLETWVYKFCELELMNALRRMQRASRVAVDEARLLGAEAPALRDRRVEFEHVYVGLDHLDPVDAVILRAKHFEEQTFDEIARLVDMPVNTVKSRAYRALEKLRRWLKDRGQEANR